MSPTHMHPIEERGRASARRDGLGLALIYAAVAGLWIMFSDRALVLLGLPLETERFIGSVKGMFYVVVTALLLYLFTVRHLWQLYTSEERYHRMFEHAAQGLMLFRVKRFNDEVIDLVVEDINPSQAMRMGAPPSQMVGWCASDRRRDLRMDAYFAAVEEAIEAGRPQQSELRLEDGTDELFSVYAIEDDLYVLGIRDVSELRAAQEALRKQDEWIREAYVDVLDAVTGGKLILMSEEEIDASLGERIMPTREIGTPEQLAEARRAVEEAVAERYPALAESMELLNPLGEVLNNVLKHAGNGTYSAFLRDGVVQICVSDNGPGIDFRTLPKATLVTGFSTTSTLGMGFTIMLQLCDRVLISTRPGRTTIVLEISPSSATSILTPEQFQA